MKRKGNEKYYKVVFTACVASDNHNYFILILLYALLHSHLSETKSRFASFYLLAACYIFRASFFWNEIFM